METISLKKDLNINKSAIRKNIDTYVEYNGYTEERFEEAMDVMTLLHQRGDNYTKQEAQLIMGWYLTPHDDCVWDNEEDFSAVEVYQVNKKYERMNKAMEIIESI
jgi:hypothetical protein